MRKTYPFLLIMGLIFLVIGGFIIEDSNVSSYSDYEGSVDLPILGGDQQ